MGAAVRTAAVDEFSLAIQSAQNQLLMIRAAAGLAVLVGVRDNLAKKMKKAPSGTVCCEQLRDAEHKCLVQALLSEAQVVFEQTMQRALRALQQNQLGAAKHVEEHVQI